MASSLAKATLTIEFSFEGSADNSLILEVVAEDNDNKTRFIPGDTVFFRLYQIGDFSYEIGSTNGSVSFVRDGSSILEDDITFTNEGRTVNLSKPATTLSSSFWYGRSLGGLTLSGYNNITSTLDGYGVVNVKYNAPYKLYSLTNGCSSIPVGLDKFIVLIYAYEIVV